MLRAVEVGDQRIASYRSSAGDAAVDEVVRLAAPLRGVRILHISATPYGGGVAEILRSEIPLLRNLGLVADWKLITGDERFFQITKLIHNGLQGAPDPPSSGQWESYLAHSREMALLLEEQYDVVIVHDPQPLRCLDRRRNSSFQSSARHARGRHARAGRATSGSTPRNSSPSWPVCGS